MKGYDGKTNLINHLNVHVHRSHELVGCSMSSNVQGLSADFDQCF